MTRRSQYLSKGRALSLAAGACIAALVLSGLPGVPASAQTAASASYPTPASAPSVSPDPSTSPTTTVPPWDATPKDPSRPTPPPPPATAAKPAGFDEKLSTLVEAETTATKRVYDNPDGSRTAKISVAPERFKDSSGKWVDYDLSIVNRSDGSLGAKAAPKAATLNKKADGNVATVQTSAGPVALRHPGVSPAAAALDKHEAKYPAALSAGRDLKIALTPDGFEESVILPDAKAPASYTEELVVPPGVTVRQSERGVELVNKAGKAIATYGDGLAYDADFPRGALPTPVSVRLVSQKANVATLEVAIADPTWLGAPGRAFPITIDPTFAQFGSAPGSGGLATWIMDGAYANNAYNGGITLAAGLYSTGNRTRTLLRFDVSSLPAGAVVTYAQLAMFNTYTGFNYSCTGRAVNAYALAGPFSSATTWNTQPAVSGAPITSHPFAHQPYPNGAGTYCPAAWEGLPVTPIVQGWMSGSPNYGVELRGNEADMSSFQHFFSSHTGQYQPYLQLNWDRVPNPPTNVFATANADGTATVNWTLATVPPNSSAVDWYVVFALNPADLSYAGDYAVLCATCTTATLTNLTPGKDYVLGVYPHNGAGYNFAPSNRITTMAIDKWGGEAMLGGNLLGTVTSQWNGLLCTGYPSGTAVSDVALTLTVSPTGCGGDIRVPAADYNVSIIKHGYVVAGGQRTRVANCASSATAISLGRISISPTGHGTARFLFDARFLSPLALSARASGQTPSSPPPRVPPNDDGEESAVCVSNSGLGFQMSKPLKVQRPVEKCTNTAGGFGAPDPTDYHNGTVTGTGWVMCADQHGNPVNADLIKITVRIPLIGASSPPTAGECRFAPDCSNLTGPHPIERSSNVTVCYDVESLAVVIGGPPVAPAEDRSVVCVPAL